MTGRFLTTGREGTALVTPGRGRRLSSLALAASGLVLVMATLAGTLIWDQQHSRSQISSNFRQHGTASATFVSDFLTQQAAREEQSARELLAGRHVSAQRFQLAVTAFGSSAAVLVGPSGRLLDVVPSDPRLIDSEVATRYAHLAAAERGHVDVSNVVASAARGAAVAAIAVPFATRYGRRVFSVAYGVAGSVLGAFVEHTISSPVHAVFLLDGTGRVLAASPHTRAARLSEADPQLARAVARESAGTSRVGGDLDSFTVTPIPGTAWRIVIAEPSSHLYASVGGLMAVGPWLVLCLVGLVGIILVALFARSLSDRARLLALSEEMTKRARTDWLTAVYNRRALTEHLTRSTAHARRHSQPVSVMMIDLDGFKETNDRFGHGGGDRVLCAIARCLQDELRIDDIYGRWGGDEFLVIMPATDEAAAAVVAARLRESAAGIVLADLGLGDGVPISIGIATACQTDPDALMRSADLDLYRAKAEASALRS
jgi:diguanylate cyclase (GGDEF)-like protein